MNYFTEIKEGLSISFAAIRANKLRSTLTTLGIIIGIVTVTLMGTAIEGLNKAFMKSVSFMGADVLYVQRFSWFIDSHEEWLRMSKRKPVTVQQAAALERQLSGVKGIAPMVDSVQPIRYQNRRSDSVQVLGTTEQYQHTSSSHIAEGRFFSPAEAQGGRPVCVIGSQVASNLFLKGSALGNKINIGQRTFEVIGVLEKQGSFLGAVSLDNQAIIPLPQFMAGIWNNPDVTIAIKIASVSDLDEATEGIRMTMRRVRQLAPSDPDDFTINQQDQFVDMFRRVAGTIAAVGLFVTGLSLFVGGIGIMNIMFVSVAERTREIGIRKAIGAKRRTILVQFLIEAAAICVLGGIIALAIAWPITLLMQRFFPATMSLLVVGSALVVSIITGLLSGFFPAWRAARLNPVDALRNE